jgi:hypothetical protein
MQHWAQGTERRQRQKRPKKIKTKNKLWNIFLFSLL